jgi:predicted anti-sigma-YlaC factor YlaD
MWRFGRHLGTAVSALVDGQLDPQAAEQAWAHVAECPECRRLVEREGWVKRRVAQMACRPAPVEPRVPLRLSAEAMEAWATVHDLERRGRGRRRAGIVIAGAGSVSVAVLGLSTLSPAPLGIGTSHGTPATSLSRGAATTIPTRAVVAPQARAHGRLPGWSVAHPGGRATYAVPVDGPG